MNAFAGLAEAINTVPEDQVRELPDRSEFRLCGVATAIAKKTLQKGQPPVGRLHPRYQKRVPADEHVLRGL